MKEVLLAFREASPLAMVGDGAVLRTDIGGVIRAGYDPVLPGVAVDASHALRLAARVGLVNQVAEVYPFTAVSTKARILPLMGPGPKRAANAVATAWVVGPRPSGSRDRISLRRGVPWQ